MAASALLRCLSLACKCAYHEKALLQRVFCRKRQKKKGTDVLKGAKTIDELKEKIVVRKPAPLGECLKGFDIILPVIGLVAFVLFVFDPTCYFCSGDAEALERVAYEMCEDQARDGVAYFEARYSPHLLATEEASRMRAQARTAY